MWVRLIWDWVRPSLVLFQFTHPCGCDFPPCGIIRSSSCFNSRTRVGATIKNGKGKFNKFVSIHAPVWVRRFLSALKTSNRWFQFTHPCGCDRIQFAYRSQDGVSIHAPVWVRPLTLKIIMNMQIVSIHAPVWVRPGFQGNIAMLIRFQFTHPCGCDQVFIKQANAVEGFNSRTRVGATPKVPFLDIYR